MDNLTNKQKNELEVIEYFIGTKIDKESARIYFDYSERGVLPSQSTSGFDRLLQGKKSRDMHTGMYEEGILDRSVPYWTLLGGERKTEIMPKAVVEFLKKSLFGGLDKDIIENTYQKVLLQYGQ